MGRLMGKVAIITGAAMGQGAVEAQLFAKEGAKVVATDVQEDKLQEVVKIINDTYGDVAMGIKHDVSSEEDWKRVVEAAVERFGEINILVNNAGITSVTPLDDITYVLWKKIMDINAWGQIIGMRSVLSEMKKAGGGSIVNISSIAGIVASGVNPYSASKGATRVLTKGAAIDFAPFNIRVNSVHPGVITTPMTEELLKTQYKEILEKQTPLGRFGTPEDVAYGVLYLASDEAYFVTGSELIIDGGLVAK